MTLLWVAVTSIAFSQKWNDLLYLKAVSLQLAMLTTQWFITTMVAYPGVEYDIHPGFDGYDGYGKSGFLIFWLGSWIVMLYWWTILAPLTMIVWVSDNYTKNFILKKLRMIKKVKIPNKYQNLLCNNQLKCSYSYSYNYNSAKPVTSDNKHIHQYNSSRYTLIGPNATDSSQNDYWKLTTTNSIFFKCNRNRRISCNCNYNFGTGCGKCKQYRYPVNCGINFTLWKMGYSIIVWLTCISTIIYFRVPVMINSTFGYIFLIVVLPLWIYSGLTSNFAKLHIVIFEFGIGGIGIFMYQLWANDISLFNIIFGSFFRSNGEYYGVIDELNALQGEYSDIQGSVIFWLDRIIDVIILWSLMLFCLVSTILYVKKHNDCEINGTYFNQLDNTIGGIFAGLFDFATDVLLIFYWIHFKLYFYAVLEILFILFGHIMTSYLMNDIEKYYINKLNSKSQSQTQLTDKFKNSNDHDTDKSKTTCTSLQDCVSAAMLKLMFLLGFGRVYHSVRAWNNNELIEYEYKWCKIWELIFETIPSVVLSTFVALMDTIVANTINSNSNSNSSSSMNVSVIVSMIFSFISITKTIVAILTKDKDQSNNNTEINLNNHNHLQMTSISHNNKNYNNRDHIHNQAQKHQLQNTKMLITSTESSMIRVPAADDHGFISDTDINDNQWQRITSKTDLVNDKDDVANHVLTADNIDDDDNDDGDENIPAVIQNTKPNLEVELKSTDSVMSEGAPETFAYAASAREDYNDGINLDQMWIIDSTTGELCFFAEKRLEKEKKEKKKCFCIRACNIFWRFDLKIENFLIWIFLMTDLFFKTLSILSIILFVCCLFIPNTSSDSVNFNHDTLTKMDIFLTIFAAIVNLLFLLFLLKMEYHLFDSMIKLSSNCIANIERDVQIHIVKYYCFVGIFSNSFYFILTLGLKYLDKMIDNQQFLSNQYFRILILCLFEFIVIFLQSSFDLWIFPYGFYLLLIFVVVVHCLSLFYIQKFIL